MKLILLSFTESAAGATVVRVGESGEWENVRFSTIPIAYGSERRIVASGTLGTKDHAKLDLLLNTLEHGEATLPAIERTLQVHFKKENAWQTKIYDRQRLGSTQRELLGLFPPTRFVGVPVLRFAPEAEERVTTKAFPAALAKFVVSPNGEHLVWARAENDVKVFDAATQEVEHTLPSLGNGWIRTCSFSPDGSFFLVSSASTEGVHVFETSRWTRVAQIKPPRSSEELRGFQMSSDNSLIILAVGRKLLTYETAEWKSRPSPPGTPEDVRWSELSEDGHRAVLWKSDYSVWLWDRDDNESVAQFDGEFPWLRACFSPDGSRVAVFTTHRDVSADPPRRIPHLRIANSANGEILCDLMPYDVRWGDPYPYLIWTPDGEYVVAASQIGEFAKWSRIHLWEAKTGRHIADFASSTDRLIGFGIAAGGKKLFAGSGHGTLYRWNFNEALAKIRKQGPP